MSSDFLFTSESVTEGHPDKIADQISDSILDAMLNDDPESRVACETLVTTGLTVVAGEISTGTWVDIPNVVRSTIRDIGYNDSRMGFDWETCGVMLTIDKQSADISRGVTAQTSLSGEQGAGDQGLVFGFACDETSELMPLPITLAHRLARRLAQVRHDRILDFLRPDGKTQVTVQYKDGRPQRVDTVVIASQHTPEVSQDTLKEALVAEVIKKVIPEGMMDAGSKIYINTTGRFVVGGPQGDCGLTGRKIIVDTYGGMGRHGGGCFSGKDPSKVDRSGSYMARYAAKNIVAAGLARKCEVQVAYAIGMAQPVSVMVDTFNTGSKPDAAIAGALAKVFDFRPAAIIRELDLKRPIYRATAAYGHFGRDGFPWEKTDKAALLKDIL
ncbi:MAG: methionine adenosyltransferase [Desulfarculales bacterium]|nr:methionine adenosyltransferase [Desulfarculales bacterium]